MTKIEENNQDRKKDAYYFTHDADASMDPKIIALIAVYDDAGYGKWWRLVEFLRSQDSYRFDISKKFSDSSLAHILRLPLDQSKKFVSDLIQEFELIGTDGTFIWSESLCRRMQSWDDTKRKYSERGRKGAAATNSRKSAQADSESRLSGSTSEENSHLSDATAGEISGKENNNNNKNIENDLFSVSGSVSEKRNASSFPTNQPAVGPNDEPHPPSGAAPPAPDQVPGYWEREKAAFLGNQIWFEKICTSKQILPKVMEDLMTVFVDDLELKEDIKDARAIREHFINWLKDQLRRGLINRDGTPKVNQQQAQSSFTVGSSVIEQRNNSFLEDFERKWKTKAMEPANEDTG